MKVLITGITGMVGSHMADYLLDKAEIVGLKRWRSPMDNVSHLIRHIKFYDGDLKDLSSMVALMKLEKPDIIYHFAAQSYVPVSFTMPINTIQNNFIGTLNLLESIRLTEINPAVVIASSSEVYGQVTKEDIPIKETCPFRPASPYAVSKCAEDMLGFQYWRSYGMRIMRMRLFTHTGARRGDVFAESSFAKQIAQIEKKRVKPSPHGFVDTDADMRVTAFQEKPYLLYVGNLDSIRTYLDVRDAVRAYWIVKYCPSGEVYNIGGDFTCTVGDTLRHLLNLSTEKNIKVIVDRERLRPSDVTLQIPCTEKFRKLTGWKPEIPFNQTMTDLLNYWRERV